MRKKLATNVSKIIAILGDGAYHDGNSLGQSLQMTRSAVWKIIKKCQQYGIAIQSVKGKGYLLSERLILLERHEIKKHLPVTLEIDVFESIDSTNQYLRQFKQVKQPKICIAEQQTQGRGRFNRHWHSPFGKNIYLSCLYPLKKDISELAGLSLLTSLSVIKTLQSFGIQENLGVKWSNDVIYDGKKLAGNLIELQAEANAGCQAIIGIGLNVNMMVDQDHVITQDWTSLQQIAGKYIDRNKLCAALIQHLLDYLQVFLRHGFSHFLEEWHRVDSLQGKSIALMVFDQRFEGKVVGINPLGQLLLQLKNGEVKAFSSGEATVLRA